MSEQLLATDTPVPELSRELLASLGNAIDAVFSRRDQSIWIKRVEVPSDAWSKDMYDASIVRAERERARAMEACASSEMNAPRTSNRRRRSLQEPGSEAMQVSRTPHWGEGGNNGDDGNDNPNGSGTNAREVERTPEIDSGGGDVESAESDTASSTEGCARGEEKQNVT